jgi:hypothetical protein
MPKCIECEKSAYFNITGQKAQYCASHKSADMINVIDKLCIYESCSKRAMFNTPEHTAPLYCLTHKLDGMVNLKSKRCAHLGCFISPIYNLIGESKGLYCIEHKTEEMVNVLSSRCISEEGCCKIAQFNSVGETKGLYCAEHKLTDMIDIKHKRCEEPGCTKSPSYKLETDTQPRFCAEHRKEDMIDGKHKKCKFSGCNKTASYNNEGIKSVLYCFDHKEVNMINQKNTYCISEWCTTRPNLKCEGYCLFCYMNLFPDKPIARNYKTKEKMVVDFIIESFCGLSWITDKKVQDGCSRRRPDLLLDLGYQVIIIEIDENQHIKYDCSCENKRLMEISQDIGHRNIVFIRFNPDEYILSDNTKVKSCWKFNKHGIVYVPKNKESEWSLRLLSLKTQIEYWLNHQTYKMIETVQLYYNENFE